MCGGNGISGEAGVGRRGAVGGAFENFRPSPRGPAASPFANFRPSPRGPAAPPGVAPVSGVPGGLASLRPTPRRARSRSPRGGTEF